MNIRVRLYSRFQGHETSQMDTETLADLARKIKLLIQDGTPGERSQISGINLNPTDIPIEDTLL